MKVKQRGFTLVEVMVAITIILIALLAILETMTTLAFSHMEVKNKVVAVNLAQSVDTLIESMGDVVVDYSGSVITFHDKDYSTSDLNKWLPVVLAMDGDTYYKEIHIPIQGVTYTVKAYARASTVKSLQPSERFNTTRDLITVLYVISWKGVGGAQQQMSFVRRYYKRGS